MSIVPCEFLSVSVKPYNFHRLQKLMDQTPAKHEIKTSVTLGMCKEYFCLVWVIHYFLLSYHPVLISVC